MHNNVLVEAFQRVWGFVNTVLPKGPKLMNKARIWPEIMNGPVSSFRGVRSS